MRFSLLKLLLAVTLAALACAGMMLHTRWSAEAMVAITIGLFAVTAVRAVGMRGRDRAFAIAFSVVGFTYLFLSGSTLFPQIEQWSITNHLLYRLAKAMNIVQQFPQTTTYVVPAPAPTLYPPATSSPMLSPSPLPTSSSPAPTSDTTSSDATPDPTPIPADASPGPTVSSPIITNPATVNLPQTSNTWLSVNQVVIDDEEINGIPMPNDAGPIGRFLMIGHCAWPWLFALLAGWFCGHIYSKGANSVAISDHG
jgi:hypothetical protein